MWLIAGCLILWQDEYLIRSNPAQPMTEEVRVQICRSKSIMVFVERQIKFGEIVIRPWATAQTWISDGASLSEPE
jgi:hypothetical protein